MGDVFGKPAIVTDTHCIRLCNKIGLVDGIKEPQKVSVTIAGLPNTSPMIRLSLIHI